MVNRLPVGAADALAPFIGRILDHLYERANAALGVPGRRSRAKAGR